MIQDNPEMAQLRREIGQGLDMEAWLASPMGRYVLERVEAERADALEQLAQVDPEDPKAIRDEQMRVQMANGFKAWLLEVVEGGRQAATGFVEAGD